MKRTYFYFFHTFQLLVSLLCLAFLPACLRPTDQANKVLFDAKTIPVLVLGGGVSGLTAAIYLTQANIPVIVAEGPKPFGALSQSHAVRNWPGQHQEAGVEIVQKIKDHAIACGAKIIQARVVEVDVRQTPFIFKLESLVDGQQTVIKAASCIVAMGTEPNFLGIPGERDLVDNKQEESGSGNGGYWGRGVSNCAICDGFFFRGKRVMVVGGGDAAVEESSYLADLAAHVTVVIRKDAFRAKDIKARQRLLNRKNVSVLFNTQIKEIKGDSKKVTAVTLIDAKGEREVTIDGVFLAIGSRPNTDLFKGQIELDERGFILLKNHQETSRPGVFAAGDVCDPVFVQAITAAGDGCRAALQVKRYLETVGFPLSSDF